MDRDLLRLALAGALVLFLYAELLRVYKVQPATRFLEPFCARFRDFRDSGRFIFSHVYLLLGCALPIWLSRHVPCLQLEEWSN